MEFYLKGMNMLTFRFVSISLSASFFIFSQASAQTAIKPVLVNVPATEDSASYSSPASDTENVFHIRPSVTSSSIGRGEQQLDFNFVCIDLQTGERFSNNPLRIRSLEAENNSGGHEHNDESRPTGKFDPLSGNTGRAAYWITTYTAPEISGAVKSELYCEPPDGYISIPYVFTINVEIPDLVTLPSNENYELIGSYGNPGVSSKHIENHFGKPELNSAIAKVAIKYTKEYPGHKISVNDLSLPQGGLFDISNNWRKPHASHRFGEDVDIQSVPTEHKAKFRQLIDDMKFSVVIDEGSHLHIRL